MCRTVTVTTNNTRAARLDFYRGPIHIDWRIGELNTPLRNTVPRSLSRRQGGISIEISKAWSHLFGGATQSALPRSCKELDGRRMAGKWNGLWGRQWGRCGREVGYPARVRALAHLTERWHLDVDKAALGPRWLLMWRGGGLQARAPRLEDRPTA